MSKSLARRVGALLAWLVALCLLALLHPSLAQAQAANLPAITATPGPGGVTNWSLPIQTLLVLTSLTFLPAVLLMMTGFTRIVIVMSLLRHALGTQTAPPNQVVVGLSLFLTLFVMSPTIDLVYTEAYLPYSENRIGFPEALTRAERGQPLPDIPVVNETLPGFVLVGWHGVMAPAGTPAPVIETLNAAFVHALTDPASRNRINASHIEVTPTSAAAFGKVLERDAEKYARIVRDAGITPE